MSSYVAPGWYPDPQAHGQLRYWDGGSWTEHTQAADPAADGSAPAGGNQRQRIEQLRGGLFTSDLSVDEFLLMKQAGLEPLGVVVGSSIHHIGYQQSAWNQNQEMAFLSRAMHQARELAMTRMEEEADQLGADGVVGVRLDTGRYEWGANIAEFTAVANQSALG